MTPIQGCRLGNAVLMIKPWVCLPLIRQMRDNMMPFTVQRSGVATTLAFCASLLGLQLRALMSSGQVNCLISGGFGQQM